MKYKAIILDLDGTLTNDAKEITPKTKAIVVTHYCGHPCDMDRIMEICYEKGCR